MTEDSKSNWESLPVLGGFLRERARLRLVQAYELVRGGADIRSAAKTMRLDPVTALDFERLMTALIGAETELRGLNDFRRTLPPEKPAVELGESLYAAERACAQFRDVVSQGRLDGAQTLSTVLQTRVWAAADTVSKLRGHLERTERGGGLLLELRREALSLLALLQDQTLPDMDWLRAHLQEVLEDERTLGSVAERYGFTVATVEQITARLNDLRSLDVPSLIRDTRDSIARVSEVYLPAIASLEGALAPYADVLGGSIPGEQLELEVEEGDLDVPEPEPETHDAFLLHEREAYERLCGLVLQARTLLGDDGRGLAIGEWLDERGLPELCLQRAQQACEDPLLFMEAQYFLGVAVVAEAWAQHQQTRDVESACRVVEDLQDLDLQARSDRLGQFREMFLHEYLPRTRARVRGLVQQLGSPGLERLLPEARALSGRLDGLAHRVDQHSLCQFDIELMGSLMQRTEDLGREAALEVSKALRSKAVARMLDDDLRPDVRWLRVRMEPTGIGDPTALKGTPLAERYEALTARVNELKAQRTAWQHGDGPQVDEGAVTMLVADVRELKREVECALLVSAEWERCRAGSKRLFVVTDGPDITEDEARHALEALYRARRNEQACVLLGRALVLPLGEPLAEAEWEALQREHLASEPAGEPDPDFWSDDPHKRIGLLLDSWGYVVPLMLWFETRSESRALTFMGHYATSRAGKKKASVDGSSLRPRTTRAKAIRDAVSRPAVSRESKQTTGEADAKARRVTAASATVFAAISADLVWLQEKSMGGPLKEVWAAEGAGLKAQYLGASQQYDSVRIRVEAAASQADSHALSRAEQEGVALAIQVQTLKRVAECVLLMDEDWTRCKVKSGRLLEARSSTYQVRTR